MLEGYEHAKNRGSTSHIENNLVFEQMLVLHNGVHVRSSSDFIFLFVEISEVCREDSKQYAPTSLHGYLCASFVSI
jgi:hypothetical protein